MEKKFERQTMQDPFLFTLEVPVNRSGTKTKQIEINKLRLLNVYASAGYRWPKNDAINRRLRKIWEKKHPIISRFFTPPSMWIDSILTSRFIKPSVVLDYGENEKVFVEVDSNDIASDVSQKIYNLMFVELKSEQFMAGKH